MKILSSILSLSNSPSVAKSGQSNALSAVLAVMMSLVLVGAPQAFAGEKSASKAQLAKHQSVAKVSLNRASIEELTNLKGIGEKKAIAIVKYRNDKGKFKSIEQLAEVKGIGPALVERNRTLLTL